MKQKFFGYFWVSLGLTLLMIACDSTSSEVMTAQPNDAVTQTPSPTQTIPLEPNPDHLLLEYPETVQQGENFKLHITNIGPHPYIFTYPENDECGWPQTEYNLPELTCDVFTELILEPGERVRSRQMGFACLCR